MNDFYIWKINGCELELDMEDAETAERYTRAISILGEADELKSKEIQYSEMIRKYCEIFRRFYDAVFGESVSEKIFAEIKDNCRKYDEVYDSFLEFVTKQRIEAETRMEGIIKRYAPKRVK